MKGIFHTFQKWFISANVGEQDLNLQSDDIDWIRVIPFITMHLGCLLVLGFGISWTAFTTALILYIIRIIAITGFYHRYFSHRTYKTNRFFQFIFALIGASAVQKGPLWWASHHRIHHRFSDQTEDVHSPITRSFFWSHIGWILSKKYYYYDEKVIQDLVCYPELVLLDRYYLLVPLTLLFSLYGFGSYLQAFHPELGTNGGQMVVWGFFISTTFLFHITASINSIAHQYGKRQYETNDYSRNNFWLALLTFGEGWHNNHHHCPISVRQGFKWYQIDITYYFLKLLEKLNIIWELRYPRKEAMTRNLVSNGAK